MLIQATVEDIKKYGEFAYRIALNPEKSCYPTYTDGIKTKADFLNAAEHAVSAEHSEILLFCIDENVEGWISYYWIPDDNYLQLNGFSINRGITQALKELIERIETKFPSYTAYFGYPGENREAIGFLEKQGFQCIERDWNHSFFFDGYLPENMPSCIEKISHRNFAKFREVYHAEPETYWNETRIFETLDDWTIFVYNRENLPSATVFFKGRNQYYEIYGTEFANGIFREDAFRDLLKAALRQCKITGAKYMTYICGKNEKPILHELGFQCVGQYILYIKEPKQGAQ